MGSPSLVTLENAIRTGWLMPVAGANVPVVWGFQNAPRPVDPLDASKVAKLYVSLLPSDVRKVGWDEPLAVDPTTTNQQVLGVREITLQVDAIGVGGLQLALDLRDALFRPTIQAALRKLKVAVLEPGNVNNLAYLYDAQSYKERGNFNARFRFATELSDPNAGAIEDVKGSTHIKAPGSPDVTEGFEFGTPYPP